MKTLIKQLLCKISDGHYYALYDIIGLKMCLICGHLEELDTQPLDLLFK